MVCADCRIGWSARASSRSSAWPISPAMDEASDSKGECHVPANYIPLKDLEKFAQIRYPPIFWLEGLRRKTLTMQNALK